jgi:hypothetical protein
MQTDEDPDRRTNQVARLLRRILLPRDFHDLLYRSDALIFDVDRAMAAVPWEIMQCDTDQPLTETQRSCPEQPEEPKHVALEMLVARQLRTTLSPSPQPDFEPTGNSSTRGGRRRRQPYRARAQGQAVAALLGGSAAASGCSPGAGGDGSEAASRAR